MARPSKVGLDYFPLDVDFFEDEKMLAISGEFAVKGEIISLRLLCEIYRNGYFVQYSELLKNKLARLGGLSGGLVDEVINKLVKYGFFDESLFREHKILTSKGVQKRYLEATKRRKNCISKHFNLLEVVNVYNNYPSNNINTDINTQIKVNEIKVNESNTPTSYSDVEEENFDPGKGEGSGKGKGINLSSIGKHPIEILKEKLAGAQSWFDQVGMKNKIIPEEVPRWFEKFCTHCLAQGEVEKTEKDFKQHFANWVSKMKSLGLGLEIKSETPKTATDVAAEVIMENYENGAYNDQY